MTDYGSKILLPTLLQRLRKEAPHSELVLSAVGPQTFDDVAAGRIDLQLCTEEVPPVGDRLGARCRNRVNSDTAFQ